MAKEHTITLNNRELQIVLDAFTAHIASLKRGRVKNPTGPLAKTYNDLIIEAQTLHDSKFFTLDQTV